MLDCGLHKQWFVLMQSTEVFRILVLEKSIKVCKMCTVYKKKNLGSFMRVSTQLADAIPSISSEQVPSNGDVFDSPSII